MIAPNEMLGGGEVADDGRVGARVLRRAGDDLAEQRSVDAARAREREQHAARLEQLQREPVEVLVGARRLLDLAFVGGQLGRVECDQVVLLGAVAQAAERDERIGFHRLADVEPVEFGVLGGDGERRSGRVDAEDVARAGAAEQATRADLNSNKTWTDARRTITDTLDAPLAANPEKTIELWTDAVTAAVSWVTQVGNGSNLILDPDLDSFYVMDAIVTKSQNVVASAGLGSAKQLVLNAKADATTFWDLVTIASIT